MGDFNLRETFHRKRFQTLMDLEKAEKTTFRATHWKQATKQRSQSMSEDGFRNSHTQQRPTFYSYSKDSIRFFQQKADHLIHQQEKIKCANHKRINNWSDHSILQTTPSKPQQRQTSIHMSNPNKKTVFKAIEPEKIRQARKYQSPCKKNTALHNFILKSSLKHSAQEVKSPHKNMGLPLSSNSKQIDRRSKVFDKYHDQQPVHPVLVIYQEQVSQVLRNTNGAFVPFEAIRCGSDSQNESEM